MAEVSVKSVVQDLLSRVKQIEASDSDYEKEISDLTDTLAQLTSRVVTLESDADGMRSEIEEINGILLEYHDLLYMEVD